MRYLIIVLIVISVLFVSCAQTDDVQPQLDENATIDIENETIHNETEIILGDEDGNVFISW